MTPGQERLIFEHLTLSDKYIGQFCRRLPTHVDSDAIRGAGREALVKAAIHFDPNHGAAFSSYLYTRTMGAMQDECRKLDPNSRYCAPEDRIGTVSMDQPIGDREGRMLLGETIRSRDFAEPVCARLDLIAALKKLPERQRLVAVAKAVGMTGHELSERLGVTESRVSQIHTETTSKLRRAMAA